MPRVTAKERQLRQLAQQYPYVKCRDGRHDYGDARITRSGTGFERTRECGRCGTVFVQFLNEWGEYTRRPLYRNKPRDYAIQGVGRVPTRIWRVLDLLPYLADAA